MLTHPDAGRVYYGYIALIAFDKPFLAQPIGGRHHIGIPIGMGVIVFTIVITGIYVRRRQRRSSTTDQRNPEGRLTK